jgi:predicted nucleic acid-binding protein
MSAAFDTNVLLYAEGVNGLERKTAIWNVLDRISAVSTYVPMQACAELFRALVLKFRWDRQQALTAVQSWQSAAHLAPLSAEGFNDALSLSTIHGLQVFDAMILSSAVEAGCTVLLSEDMTHGFLWRGCTVVNPFDPHPHPALKSLAKS